MLIQVIKVQIKGFLPITKIEQFEEVGFIFNKPFITDLLREKLSLKDMSTQIRGQWLAWHGALKICR